MKHPLVLLPDERRRYRRHQFWTDHGIFRELFYANFHEIAPGVFRSAQPSPVQLRHWQQQHGLCTVLNLRAPAPHEPHYRLEQETCDALGMTHLTLHGFGSRDLPERDKLLAGIEVLDQLPKPFLCTANPGRIGLVSSVCCISIWCWAYPSARRNGNCVCGLSVISATPIPAFSTGFSAVTTMLPSASPA